MVSRRLEDESPPHAMTQTDPAPQIETPPPAPVILQILPSLQSGGVERSALEITQAITRAGGVALVASAGGRMVPAILRAGGTHIAMKLKAKAPWAIWGNAARLTRLLRARDVAIVHARSRAPAWSAWLACRRTGTPFVTTWHGLYRENLPFKYFYNAVMARGVRVIANSRYTASIVTQRYGVGPDRLRIIPRGVDPAIFDPDRVKHERLARLAASWRLPDGAPTIMLPARLSPRKGPEVLIRALARMRHQDAVVVLVGDAKNGLYRKRLLRLAHRLGVSSRLRLPGHCADMPAALMLSDVVVSASVEPEAFGRTIIEAQAMARLSVATDHGGAVETIIEGQTGWRVPPGDAEALADLLDRLLDMPPAERAAAGARARAHVCAHYTVHAMQEATLAVYSELLG